MLNHNKQVLDRRKNATAPPVSQFKDTWNFMNMGTEVDPNPKVELPQPPSWKNCQQNGPEGYLRDLAAKAGDLKFQSQKWGSTTVSDRHIAKVTILETVAYSEEEKDMPSPLEKTSDKVMATQDLHKVQEGHSY